MLNDENIHEIGTNAKVNPPLRSKKDVEAIKQGLAEGIIDIIASDHAPHSPEEKGLSYDQVPFGIIGLETTLGLVLTHLVRPCILTFKQAIEKMTILPAKIFGLDEFGIGSLTPGTKANITIIDLGKKWKTKHQNTQGYYMPAKTCPTVCLAGDE